ncbi:MAG: hypothetical protein M1816_001402 [Peltula sp. TS41687]|nr:MAG: hypothetical protein M1816_001402 [Peltula sp. TS41687]
MVAVKSIASLKTRVKSLETTVKNTGLRSKASKSKSKPWNPIRIRRALSLKPGPVGPGRSVGNAALIRSLGTYRVSIKRTVKQLEFGPGATSTRFQQQLWVDRFNAFRQNVLRQSLTTPFRGDDLVRFFDAIIDIIRPGAVGKPAPMMTFNGLAVLSNYNTFTYSKSSGYQLTKQDGLRIKTFIDNAVADHRLTKANGLAQWPSGRPIQPLTKSLAGLTHWLVGQYGEWVGTRAWLGFMTMSRMARAWLDHREGTLIWDVALAHFMTVVLVTSLGSRPRCSAQLRQSPGFDNLHAAITLEFTEGAKDQKNVDQIMYLRPINDSKSFHMCPIALLLVHALRHGLVQGKNIQEVLNLADSLLNLGTRSIARRALYPKLPLFGVPARHLKRPMKPDWQVIQHGNIILHSEELFTDARLYEEQLRNDDDVVMALYCPNCDRIKLFRQLSVVTLSLDGYKAKCYHVYVHLVNHMNILDLLAAHATAKADRDRPIETALSYAFAYFILAPLLEKYLCLYDTAEGSPHKAIQKAASGDSQQNGATTMTLCVKKSRSSGHGS